MKKIILLFMFMMIFSTGFTQEMEDQTKIKNLLATMNNSSVSIFSIGKMGNGVCSGVVLSNDNHSVQVLTAKHCTDVYEEVYVEDVKVTYTVESIDDDLAVMIMSKKILNKVAVKFAKSNSKRNTIIYHIGFPDLNMYPSIGLVVLEADDYTYAKMSVIQGCSGGGVFTESGELVGILVAKIQVGDGVAVYESITDINRFLKTIDK